MERKTFLYQPSGNNAAVTPYANVSAPAGAFGDATGALADLGRGIGNAVAGAANYVEASNRAKEIKLAKENRDSQESKRRGFELYQASWAATLRELEDAKQAADPSNPAYNAIQEGTSAIWTQNRQKEVFASFQKENKWTPPTDENQAREFAVATQTYGDTQYVNLRDNDTRRMTEKRTTTANQSTDLAFGDPNLSGFDDIMSVYDQTLATRNSESGTDKADALRHLVNRLEIHLYKNPLPLDASAERRIEVANRLREAGVREGAINNYVRPPEKDKKPWADFKAVFGAQAAEGTFNFEQAKAQVALFGHTGESEMADLISLAIGQEIDRGKFSVTSMEGDTVTQVLNTPSDPSFFNDTLVKNYGESVKFLTKSDRAALWQRVKDNATTVLKAVKSNPALAAETRNASVAKLGQAVATAKGDPVLAGKLIEEYSAAVNAELVGEGFGDLIDQNQKHAPSVIVDGIRSGSFTFDEMLSFHKSFGGRVFRDTISSMPVGPKRVVSTIFSLTNPDAFDSVSPDVIGTLQSLSDITTSAPQIDAFKKNLAIDVRGIDGNPISPSNAIDNGFYGITASGKSSGLLDTISGKNTESIGSSLKTYAQAIAFTQGLSQADEDALVESLKMTALASAASDTASPPGLALANAYSGITKAFANAGLFTSSHRTDGGKPVVFWYPVESARSVFEFADDGKIDAGSIDQVEQALSATIQAFEQAPRRLANKAQGGFWNWAEEQSKDFFSYRTFGAPWPRNEVSSRSISMPELLHVFKLKLSQAQAAGMTTQELRALGNSSTRLTPDGSGNLVFSVRSGQSAALGGFASLGGRQNVAIDALKITQEDIATGVHYSLMRDSREPVKGASSIKPVVPGGIPTVNESLDASRQTVRKYYLPATR